MKTIDDELMGESVGYKSDQLIELAGLSVALCIFDVIQKEDSWKSVKNVLTICGPGSNSFLLR